MERLSLQMQLDRHATMLNDLLDAGRLRRAKQQDLKRSLERNEELPVEEFARNNDMGPLPVTLERYTALRPQRMSAPAVAAPRLRWLRIGPLTLATSPLCVPR